MARGFRSKPLSELLSDLKLHPLRISESHINKAKTNDDFEIILLKVLGLKKNSFSILKPISTKIIETKNFQSQQSDQFIFLWEEKRWSSFIQTFLSSSRTGSSFSNRWKGSKNLVKTNPRPGVLTDCPLASIETKLKPKNTILIGHLIQKPLQYGVFVPPKEKKREENWSSERYENFPVWRPKGGVWKFLAKRIRFLAFCPSAAALFGYFFQLKGKSNSQSGWRTR